MTRQSVEARPCTDPDCGAKHTLGERVALAISLCDARGVRLTPVRRTVLELLWEAARPMGAYELIEALRSRDSRPVGPPTVYRALEFLMAQGLATRIESRNAYVPRVHPDRPSRLVFFICCDCGGSTEFSDPRIEALLAQDAAALRYRVMRRVVEVEGTCANCVGTQT
ncbi:Fur family transcriptional regulator [Mycolicibacterium chlorophenolicum]|uniref:Fur family transcriptional regulator n=1 Tax=Mycolicibacterium chlorophenolicum TaxID=37916 RepID=UPI0009E4EAE0